jgi:DNA-binding NtrC family response regulator
MPRGRVSGSTGHRTLSPERSSAGRESVHSSVARSSFRVLAHNFHQLPQEAILIDVLLDNRTESGSPAARAKRGALASVQVTSLPPEPVILGRSPIMRAIRLNLGEIKDDDSPVLVAGESGTGKEVIVTFLHHPLVQ